MGKPGLLLCAVGVCVIAASAQAGDPITEGLLPAGFAANHLVTFEIALSSRIAPPSIGFGRTNRALAVGDIDGDGRADVVMGFAECAFGDCDTQSGATRAGVVRAYSGATGEVLVEIVGQPWATPAQIDAFGAEIALADVNADGRMDFVIAAPLANSGRGRVDVFDSSGAFVRTINGPVGAERFGNTIIRLGDATLDQRDDFLVLDSSDAGRLPTLWSYDGDTGALLHSRQVLSDRVDVLGDLDGDGIAEYSCGAPEFTVPQERARAMRGDTGAVVFGYNAGEGFLSWLGDIDNDGFGEFVQFNILFEFRGVGAFADEGPVGFPGFPPPLRALRSADFSGDGANDAAMIHGGPLGDFDPLDDEINLVDARTREPGARFLPRHRALVGGVWMRHEMRSASFGDIVLTIPSNSDDIAFEVYPVDAQGEPDESGFDRFVVAVYAGPWLPGDANADGRVDFRDLNLALSRFHRYSDLNRSGDVNSDGTVNHEDLTIVMERYGSIGPSLPPRGAAEGCEDGLGAKAPGLKALENRELSR